MTTTGANGLNAPLNQGAATDVVGLPLARDHYTTRHGRGVVRGMAWLAGDGADPRRVDRRFDGARSQRCLERSAWRQCPAGTLQALPTASSADTDVRHGKKS